MKVLTLIAHTDAQESLTDLFRSIDHVGGFTFSHVEGHGIEVEKESFLAAHDAAMGLVPRLRADLFLQDTDIDAVLQRIADADIGLKSKGLYWVTPIEKGGRL